ncbi:uncharacterized protein [Primulina eburnea]|uniref:uncharacterized protein n=1 Tax=Primulina eburnea TaxID=1245227 RepID=UPI003C6C8990
MQACLLILSILILMKSSYANQNSSCNPSSCGDIRNISYPFRLKDDPLDCGISMYEISCENNTASSVYVDSYKYHVRAINYQNYTIRLADPNIKNNDTCSFPSHFSNWANLSRYNNLPYSLFSYNFGNGVLIQIAKPITFFSCPFPLNDSASIPTYTCRPSSSHTSITHHTYIKFGFFYAPDVRDLCRIVFGMLLMEMVGLRQDLTANDQNSSKYFPDWVYDHVNKGKDVDIGEADQTDDECRGKIKRMTIVALWCIQMSPDDRPSMSKVLEMLESETELLQIPPHPSELSQQVAENEDDEWETYSDSVTLLFDDTLKSRLCVNIGLLVLCSLVSCHACF